MWTLAVLFYCLNFVVPITPANRLPSEEFCQAAGRDLQATYDGPLTKIVFRCVEKAKEAAALKGEK